MGAPPEPLGAPSAEGALLAGDAPSAEDALWAGGAHRPTGAHLPADVHQPDVHRSDAHPSADDDYDANCAPHTGGRSNTAVVEGARRLSPSC